MTTATTDPFDTLTDHRTREHLAEQPLLRYEAVARHYRRLAAHAIQMTKLIELKQHARTGIMGDEETLAYLAECEREIVDAHVEAFGVKPAWLPQETL